ncbi:PGF-pre-PGF domain-containing protein [Salinarchaeum sp. IM2453]|uniref:PGF-pre-PGF domain-containing protein n=1 Tax=Salinarchaeum sp. IM2453 TaxID=2862870 RepID=UPI001C82D0F4|nr:PGF-pre-PGF domain-containing protein [Salinarchaeum sp. IM2453]QZA89143.1 PGF-pre-PGF domain-containing protein [Salinarchaeum sp. IM2453]
MIDTQAHRPFRVLLVVTVLVLFAAAGAVNITAPSPTETQSSTDVEVESFEIDADFIGVVNDDTVTVSADGVTNTDGEYHVAIEQSVVASINDDDITDGTFDTEIDPTNVGVFPDDLSNPDDASVDLLYESNSDDVETVATTSTRIVHEVRNLTDNGFSSVSIPQNADLYTENVTGSYQWDPTEDAYVTPSDNGPTDEYTTETVDLHEGWYFDADADARLGLEFDDDSTGHEEVTISEGWHFVGSNYNISDPDETPAAINDDLGGIDFDDDDLTVYDADFGVINQPDRPIAEFEAYWLEADDEIGERTIDDPSYNTDARFNDVLENDVAEFFIDDIDGIVNDNGDTIEAAINNDGDASGTQIVTLEVIDNDFTDQQLVKDLDPDASINAEFNVDNVDTPYNVTIRTANDEATASVNDGSVSFDSTTQSTSTASTASSANDGSGSSGAVGTTSIQPADRPDGSPGLPTGYYGQALDGDDEPLEEGTEIYAVALDDDGIVESNSTTVDEDGFYADEGAFASKLTLSADDADEVSFRFGDEDGPTSEESPIDYEDGTFERNLTFDLADPNFEVSITGSPDEVTEGDDIEIDYEIENTGDLEGTQDIEFLVDDELEATEENVTIGAGDTFSNTFTYETAVDDIGDVIFTVASANDSAEATVSVVAAVEEIELELDANQIRVDRTTEATVTAQLSNDTDIDVTDDATITSADDDIASVDDTTVTGVGSGVVDIEATYEGNDDTASLRVLSNPDVLDDEDDIRDLVNISQNVTAERAETNNDPTYDSDADETIYGFTGATSLEELRVQGEISGAVTTTLLNQTPPEVGEPFDGDNETIVTSQLDVPDAATDQSGSTLMNVSTDAVDDVNGDVDNLSVVRYNDTAGTWETLEITATEETDDVITLRTEVPDFSLFAITADVEEDDTDEVDEEEEDGFFSTWMLIPVLIILLVILAFLIYLFYQQQQTDENLSISELLRQ